jgi:hypothetical protein
VKSDNLTATIEAHLLRAAEFVDAHPGQTGACWAIEMTAEGRPDDWQSSTEVTEGLFADTYREDARLYWSQRRKLDRHYHWWFGQVSTESDSRILGLLLLREMLRTERRPKCRARRA